MPRDAKIPDGLAEGGLTALINEGLCWVDWKLNGFGTALKLFGIRFWVLMIWSRDDVTWECSLYPSICIVGVFSLSLRVGLVSLYTSGGLPQSEIALWLSSLFSRSNVVNDRPAADTLWFNSTVFDQLFAECSLLFVFKKKFFLASSECGEWTWNAKPPPGSVDVLFLPFPDWFCLINSTGWQHLKDPLRTKRSKTKPLPILVTPSCYYLNKFYNQV